MPCPQTAPTPTFIHVRTLLTLCARSCTIDECFIFFCFSCCRWWRFRWCLVFCHQLCLSAQLAPVRDPRPCLCCLSVLCCLGPRGETLNWSKIQSPRQMPCRVTHVNVCALVPFRLFLTAAAWPRLRQLPLPLPLPRSNSRPR